MPRAVADAFNRVAEDGGDARICFIGREMQVLTSGLILELLERAHSLSARQKFSPARGRAARVKQCKRRTWTYSWRWKERLWVGRSRRRRWSVCGGE
jgi:hypothetical protein